MRVYKGIIFPKYYGRSAWHGKSKKYFYTPIKKLFGDFWWTIYYKKNTQFYRKEAIEFLMQYVSVAINEVTNVGNKKFLEEKDISVMNGKNTLLVSCYSKQDDSYIGSPYKVMRLIEEKNITEFYGDGANDFSVIGYSKEDKKLYHWNKTGIMEIQTKEKATSENIQIIDKQREAEMIDSKK